MIQKIRVGVIPAAGQGRRLGYLSSILPKALFPLYDRPIIHHVVDKLRAMGVDTVYVIVNYKRQRIEEYFTESQQSLGVDSSILVQKRLSGIADAIALTEERIHEPFACILGDDVTLGSLTPLTEMFRRVKPVVAEVVVEEKDTAVLKDTCCVQLASDGRITRIAEKPLKPFSRLRGCGIYLFRPEVYDYIRSTPKSEPRGEREITNVIGKAALDGLAYGQHLHVKNFNINSSDDLLRAWQEAKREWNHPS